MALQDLICAVQSGLTFNPMSESESEKFQGIEDGTMIAYSDLAIFFLKDDKITVLSVDYETTYSLSVFSEIEKY